jgi:DNA polymerase-3 subunit delta
VQLKAEQLLSQLEKKSVPLVWIAGDETLLVQEACDSVRLFARQQGFTDREIYTVTNSFDWHTLLESGNSLSLFAERKLIDLRLNSAKLDNEAKKALQSFLENPSEDNLLMISSPRVEKASTQTKWFREIEETGYFVPIWPITNQDLPGWIRQRLHKHGLKADEQALRILCQRTEGNLLATAQEIDKLSILSDSAELDAQTVARAVADSSRFNVFTLIDTALESHTGRALNILQHLKAEGEDALRILNFICREIRSLIAMAEEMRTGTSTSAVMQQYRVWRNRQGPVAVALRQHDPDSLQAMLDHAARIDQSVKGLNRLNTWDELADLLLELSGTPLTQSA